MICHTCRFSLLSRFSHPPRVQLRSSRCILSQPRRNYSTPTPPDTSSSEAASSAPSPDTASEAGKKGEPKVKSSVMAGAPLAGLNYFKDKPEVRAMEDSEYPSWLWGLLNPPKRQDGVPGSNADTSAMNRVQRKKHEKKLAERAARMPTRIPLHEQSTDVTPASAVGQENVVVENLNIAKQGIKARGEIKKSSREQRRKGIKESNYLRGV